MVMGIGLKSVWISLRATNYSDRAFRAAIGNLSNLTKEERKHAEEMLQMRDIMRMNIATGVLWAANLSIVAQGIFGLMAQTQAGAEYMESFNQTINDAKVAFADTFFETLRPVLDVVKGFLDILKQNAPLRIVVVLLTLTSMALIGVYAATKLLTGIKAFYLLQLGAENQKHIMGIAIKYKDIIATKLQTLAHMNLAMALGMVTAGLTVFLLFGTLLGKHAGPIVAALAAITLAVLALAVALNILSVGTLTAGQLGALAAGAGMAAGVLALQSAESFQMGTRGLPHTGLFYGHKGEVVYNPHTDRPTGMVEGESEMPSTTIQDIDVTIEHVHTKAEFDDLEEQLSRSLWKKSRGSR